ncbi:MAG: NUDIX domain-containing protein [Saprospiraceae bacterium]|nr:NUDIX domain-containing protein [Saprospiraceae bacterium]
MMDSEGNKRAAVFCIINSGDHYLLLKRANDPNKGKFVPVGGKINPYESPYQAVVRETHEETGLHLSTFKFCGVLTETSPTNYNWVSFIYSSEIEFIPAPHCDEGELFWIHKNQLKHLNTPPTDWHIYQYIFNNIPFVFSAEYDSCLNMTKIVDELSGIILQISQKKE